MRHIKSPNKVPVREAKEKYLFLAGSIEMGEAEDWQALVVGVLANTDWIILNPRRDEWDNTLEQSIKNEKFREQVEWELDGQDMADKILIYFAPDTKSPITLLELGLYAASGKVTVCCPSGFWRRGNIEMVCARYNIPLFIGLEEALTAL